MKKFLFIFFIAFMALKAQTNRYLLIEYKDINETPFNIISNGGKLYVDLNNQTTLYIQDKPKINKKIYKDNRIIISNNTLSKKKNSNIFVFADYNNNKLYNHLPAGNDWYLVEEDIPKIEWNLLDETKVIENNRILYKAEADFRGRSYEAWYSLDFPFQYGPWKFSGLPGLIFEITGSSSTGDYLWYLTEIKELKKEDVLIPKLEQNIISLKEYIEMSDESDLQNAILESKRMESDTGIIIESSSQYIQRIGAELIYEWEN